MASNAMFPVIAEVKMFPSSRNAITSELPEAKASSARPKSVDPRPSGFVSEVDNLAILSRFVLHVAEPAEHVFTHVGENHAPRTDRREMLTQRRQRQMRAHRPVVHVAFTNEQIGPAGGIDQRIDPLGVAGIADCPAIQHDSLGETGPGAIIVPDMERR